METYSYDAEKLQFVIHDKEGTLRVSASVLRELLKLPYGTHLMSVGQGTDGTSHFVKIYYREASLGQEVKK